MRTHMELCLAVLAVVTLGTIGHGAARADCPNCEVKEYEEQQRSHSDPFPLTPAWTHSYVCENCPGSTPVPAHSHGWTLAARYDQDLDPETCECEWTLTATEPMTASVPGYSLACETCADEVVIGERLCRWYRYWECDGQPACDIKGCADRELYLVVSAYSCYWV